MSKTRSPPSDASSPSPSPRHSHDVHAASPSDQRTIISVCDAVEIETRSVSPPRSSNRTCRFPASGFPTGFIIRRTSPTLYARDLVAGRRVPRKHAREETVWRRAPAFVYSAKKRAHAVVEMTIDSLIRRGNGAIAKPSALPSVLSVRAKRQKTTKSAADGAR